jgi:hypothetical protein
MLCYCLKCKCNTECDAAQMIQTSNNRNRIKSKCAVCGSRKSVFASSEQSGDGWIDLGKSIYKNRDTIQKAFKVAKDLHAAYQDDT